MPVVAVERLKRLELRLGSRISHPLDGLVMVIERIMMMMMMITMMIMMITCHEVTNQTSSMAVIVSKNSSKPSLWWGVVNLVKEL